VYGAVRRDNQTESDELLRMFDFPNPRISSSGRSSTTTPQQQLFSLNSRFVIERARALAARVTPLPGDKLDAAGIGRVFLLVLSREPSSEELTLAESFFNADAAVESAGALSRCEQFCQVLMNSNEALHRP
ncbi:MAG: DUF1553 domain-containing protein, partial [Planctomycetota bacterium]|nr:DUF1553 domain-containing protein [Planctomycetota bacterium]